MKLDSSLWSKFKWLITTVIAMKRKSYPLTVLGVRLLIAAAVTPVAAMVLRIYFPDGFILSGVEFTANEASLYTIVFDFILVLCGIVLIYKELKSTARHTARVLITGLPGTSNSFPNDILHKAEQHLAREAVELSVPEPKNGNHLAQVERYNAELCVDLFKRFILHDDCKKLYVGGLARIPFLVAYGALLRNISSQIVNFDKFHRGGNWKLLNEEDRNITFSEYKIVKQPNEHGDIGIAIGFSAPISEEQLPNQLKNFTTILHPNTGTDRNLVQNQENLQRISETVRDLVEELCREPTCQRIHLFFSVQSSLALELGRRFQEGTQRNWIIHNFNFSKGEYDWAIELSNSGIKEFKFK